MVSWVGMLAPELLSNRYTSIADNRKTTMALILIYKTEQVNGKIQAKVYRDNEWNEYRTRFYDADGKLMLPADYYTGDKQDAIESADTYIKLASD
jgi:hypothetical protein